MAESSNWPYDIDPYLVTGAAKSHLADSAMTESDRQAWWVLDFAQALHFLAKEEEEETRG